MNDLQCVAFVHWALPRLRMRWEGLRKVRRQVCKRLYPRLSELGLPDLAPTALISTSIPRSGRSSMS